MVTHSNGIALSPHGPLRTRRILCVLTIELIVAVVILVGVLIPVGFSIIGDQRLARNYYTRAVAMEIVDGELEVLAAGEWRSFPSGAHPYEVRAASAKNLPPGQFTLTVDDQRVRLEWNPATNGHGGSVFREFRKSPEK
jgi:hypothetical protein